MTLDEKRDKLCADLMALTEGQTLADWMTATSITAAWVCVDSGASKEEFSRIFSKCYDLAVTRRGAPK